MNNTYTKTYDELYYLVGRADAVLYSFILRQAETQGTNTPLIEQTYLQNTFGESKYIIKKSLQNLKDKGLLDFERTYKHVNGKAYTTTKFTLLYQIGSKEETIDENTIEENEEQPVQETTVSSPNFLQMVMAADEPKNVSKANTAEPLPFEDAPCSTTEDNEDEIGIRMMEQHACTYTPTKDTATNTYSRTPTPKKKKEIWQMNDKELYEAAQTELSDWYDISIKNAIDREEFDKQFKTLCIEELPEKYNLNTAITTQAFVEWRNTNGKALYGKN